MKNCEKSNEKCYFLLKKTRILEKTKEKPEIFSFDNVPKEKISVKTSFLLRNDYLQVSNRIFFAKKLKKIDENLINSMKKVSKSLILTVNSVKKLDFMKKWDEIPSEKNNFFWKKDEKTDEKKTMTKNQIKNVERQEKLKKLLNQTFFSKEIEEMQRKLKPKLTNNKKVSFLL